MNDMEWGGTGTPEGPFVSGERGEGQAQAQAGASDKAVSAEEALAVAEGLFWSYVKDLERHKSALTEESHGSVDPAELKQAIRTAKDIREAVHLLMAERNRVEKLRKDIAGGVGAGCLDLDAARDEIGRRLACLRRAGGG
ncbi:permease [Paracoccus fistulariae]|uniref:Permease n=1 Tax=Paracoccus fistulariae TaxID=658446 RepID=A0ABY7SL04_9RHOB|nr:permease [Paracoccus fistulariae]MDB6181498.1 permease [Paracoccus fistulariae]WCR07534.1 permease [Paracoccus fistulariae]